MFEDEVDDEAVAVDELAQGAGEVGAVVRLRLSARVQSPGTPQICGRSAMVVFDSFAGLSGDSVVGQRFLLSSPLASALRRPVGSV